jgi:ribonuclease-3
MSNINIENSDLNKTISNTNIYDKKEKEKEKEQEFNKEKLNSYSNTKLKLNQSTNFNINYMENKYPYSLNLNLNINNSNNSNNSNINTKTNDFDDLYIILNYKFQDEKIIRQALTRQSAIGERIPKASEANYQRLEFFGDSLLNLIITEMIFEIFIEKTEESLSPLRSDIIKNEFLATLAEKMNLGKFIIIGKGEEKQNCRKNKNILADIMEAIIAAMYFDTKKDIKFIKSFFFFHFGKDIIEKIGNDEIHKTRLLDYFRKNIKRRYFASKKKIKKDSNVNLNVNVRGNNIGNDNYNETDIGNDTDTDKGNVNDNDNVNSLKNMDIIIDTNESPIDKDKDKNKDKDKDKDYFFYKNNSDNLNSNSDNVNNNSDNENNINYKDYDIDYDIDNDNNNIDTFKKNFFEGKETLIINLLKQKENQKENQNEKENEKFFHKKKSFCSGNKNLNENDIIINKKFLELESELNNMEKTGEFVKIEKYTKTISKNPMYKFSVEFIKRKIHLENFEYKSNENNFDYFSNFEKNLKKKLMNLEIINLYILSNYYISICITGIFNNYEYFIAKIFYYLSYSYFLMYDFDSALEVINESINILRSYLLENNNNNKKNSNNNKFIINKSEVSSYIIKASILKIYIKQKNNEVISDLENIIKLKSNNNINNNNNNTNNNILLKSFKKSYIPKEELDSIKILIQEFQILEEEKLDILLDYNILYLRCCLCEIKKSNSINSQKWKNMQKDISELNNIWGKNNSISYFFNKNLEIPENFFNKDFIEDKKINKFFYNKILSLYLYKIKIDEKLEKFAMLKINENLKNFISSNIFTFKKNFDFLQFEISWIFFDFFINKFNKEDIDSIKEFNFLANENYKIIEKNFGFFSKIYEIFRFKIDHVLYSLLKFEDFN